MADKANQIEPKSFLFVQTFWTFVQSTCYNSVGLAVPGYSDFWKKLYRTPVETIYWFYPDKLKPVILKWKAGATRRKYLNNFKPQNTQANGGDYLIL